VDLTLSSVAVRMRALPRLLGRPLRRRYYTRGRSWDRLPRPLSELIGLDDEGALGSRRLELGSGIRPTPGYLHLDGNRWAYHLEYRADVLALPFPDDWAEEILAIHVLEHVHPRMLIEALSEWLRVLAPGGRLRVHVPDSAALMDRWRTASLDEKWALMAILFGMRANPRVRAPSDLKHRADHQVAFDREVLEWALRTAGYSDIRDLTGHVSDVHTVGWESLVPSLSLIYEARA